MSFVVVTGTGEVLDFNEHEVLWLTEEQIATLYEFDGPDRYEIAYTYHEMNWEAYLKKIGANE